MQLPSWGKREKDGLSRFCPLQNGLTMIKFKTLTSNRDAKESFIP
jgi:hypothetical protein